VKPHTRNRPAKLVTLAPEVWAKLDEMARRRSTPESKSSRSAEVERAVRGAKMPKVRQTGGT
jgi:hypothetical protein